MKVLILSITAGQGHHACGAAISDYLKSKGVQCRMLDCLSYINKLLGESVSQGYLLSTQYSPAAYGTPGNTEGTGGSRAGKERKAQRHAFTA